MGIFVVIAGIAVVARHKVYEEGPAGGREGGREGGRDGENATACAVLCEVPRRISRRVRTLEMMRGVPVGVSFRSAQFVTADEICIYLEAPESQPCC